jgi:lambda family phage portal protein
MGPLRADNYIFRNWNRFVSRCQHEVENSDHARKFVQLLRENVAGPHGATLQPQVTQPDGTPDKPACDAIIDAYAQWSHSRNYSADGVLTRAATERLAISQIADTGEILAQLLIGEDASDWGFAVHLLDPSRLDPQHCEDRRGTFIKHGIEFAPNGRPVAYWLRRDNPLARPVAGTASHSGYFDVIPASQIVHAYIRERPGQLRGLPQMRTSCGRLRVLSDFEDCALVNARVGAAKMGFIVRPVDYEPLPSELDEDGDIYRDAEPGVIEDIGPGDFREFNPQFPDAAIELFTRSILRSIASGLGVSYNNLASDLTSVNFSSIRQGALDEREVWRGLQRWFIAAFVRPIFDAWLSYSVLAGKIAVNGQPLHAQHLERYRQCEFVGRTWAWIDPVSEMTAAEKAVNLKVKSRSAIVRDLGEDPWNTWNEIASEEADMVNLGIDPVFVAPGATNPPKKSED